MEAGRRRHVRRALMAGLGFSAIWAAWWLWPSGPQKPDFLFDTHPTSWVSFDDLTEDIRPKLPYFEAGSFHSPSGLPLRPKDIIRDARHPQNIDSPEFFALFRLRKGATRADFVEATQAIWAVCDAAIAVATDDQEDSYALLPVERGRDCDYLFPVETTTDQVPS
ncbi:MAG TPA: hypothetical protein PKD99_11115 [Sphingopyxis sp.]|nr:hypothetical protein [Sphingopyxis sp.]HMP45647.1 hypothetical protein [Sphingopyxis sp.]HMQ18048.1 hypothetical protein [Sphingopyxis sp.]